MYKRILVPLDGSELAEQVLPHVTELAQCTGAEIILLRVASLPVYDYLVPEPRWSNEIRQAAEQEALRYLERVSRGLRERGLTVKTSETTEGPVHEIILDLAHQLNVDLIAMSTHGRGGLARLVMGSVADQVIRHVTIPVLLVRPHPIPPEPHSIVLPSALHRSMN